MRHLLAAARRSPYELTLSIFAVLAGLVQAWTGQYPPSVHEAIGTGLTAIWVTYLIAGGLALLIGVVWPRLLLQLVGTLWTATSLTVYALALLVTGGTSYLLGAGVLLAIISGLTIQAVALIARVHRGER